MNLGLSMLAILIVVFLALAFSSYVKIVTVLGILRVGIGFGGLPSMFVTGSLALALTLFVMFPTLTAVTGALDNAVKGKGVVSDADRGAAITTAVGVWTEFLGRYSHPEEKERFAAIATALDKQTAKPAPASAPTAQGDSPQEVSGGVDKESFRIVAPAFLVSELKEAFATGLSLFLPFLVLDLLVANILTSIGLIQLNPALVAFPFKLLLFVMVDGWSLITTNLVSTYVK